MHANVSIYFSHDEVEIHNSIKSFRAISCVSVGLKAKLLEMSSVFIIRLGH
jgi:hypothetical protein